MQGPSRRLLSIVSGAFLGITLTILFQRTNLEARTNIWQEKMTLQAEEATPEAAAEEEAEVSGAVTAAEVGTEITEVDNQHPYPVEAARARTV